MLSLLILNFTISESIFSNLATKSVGVLNLEGNRLTAALVFHTIKLIKIFSSKGILIENNGTLSLEKSML